MTRQPGFRKAHPAFVASTKGASLLNGKKVNEFSRCSVALIKQNSFLLYLAFSTDDVRERESKIEQETIYYRKIKRKSEQERRITKVIYTFF